MSVIAILLSLAMSSAFAWWVIFSDGAEILEGWKSLLFFGLFAPAWTAQEIRFFVGISWLVSVVMMGIAAFS